MIQLELRTCTEVVPFQQFHFLAWFKLNHCQRSPSWRIKTLGNPRPGYRPRTEQGIRPRGWEVFGGASGDLRQLREEKKYLKCSATWRVFCSEYLKMKSGHADRIIRLWEEFGAGYFELAQLTRCSPETYRAIEPAVKEGTLRYQDETIELHPENARKVATAVASLRKKPARQLEMHERLHEIDRRCRAIAEELEEISRKDGMARIGSSSRRS